MVNPSRVNPTITTPLKSSRQLLHLQLLQKHRLSQVTFLRLVPQPRAKPPSIYTDSDWLSGQLLALEYYGNNEGSLPRMVRNSKNGSDVQNVLDATLLPAALGHSRLVLSLGHCRLYSLEAKVIHLTDTCTKNTALKKTNSQTSVRVQRYVLSNDNFGKTDKRYPTFGLREGETISKI